MAGTSAGLPPTHANRLGAQARTQGGRLVGWLADKQAETRTGRERQTCTRSKGICPFCPLKGVLGSMVNRRTTMNSSM